ncbi:hypothetical protein [Pseudoalteromonas sp. Z9A5]|uniref:hypothetical protein n=1 Tax=Pseudoalteromonas sp. Z9A5 TaxID=2686355 RepID=UPI001408203C|nr:hypothetical protein [Pseudoalteromonas sp. Z9A5]
MNINWSLIRGVGNSSLVKSNYFWLFLLPFIYKNLDLLQSAFGFELKFSFSINRLFYASLFFALGTIIYQFRCPKIIKEYSSYDDFRSDMKNTQHIVDYYVDSYKMPFSKLDIKGYSASLKELDTQVANLRENCSLIRVEAGENTQRSYIHPDKERELFWLTYSKLDSSFFYSKAAVFILYLLGIICLSVVSVENIIFTLIYIT